MSRMSAHRSVFLCMEFALLSRISIGSAFELSRSLVVSGLPSAKTHQARSEPLVSCQRPACTPHIHSTAWRRLTTSFHNGRSRGNEGNIDSQLSLYPLFYRSGWRETLRCETLS